jgi:Big-like domain-containing protein
VNGVFGDGNDVVTHFDMGQFGALDPEGIGFDTARDLVVVMDNRSKRIYEVTRGGSLVRLIDVSGIPGSSKNMAGMTIAPASNGSGVSNYWIADRGVDNNQDPNENDGKVYEVTAPSPSTDARPTVSLTEPAEGSVVQGTVAVRANASDDKGITQVQFFRGTTSLGTDKNGADGWSVSWNTTTVADGSHTLTATATDTIGQTASDSNTVTVDNTPPTAAVTSPDPGATVLGTIAVEASATDAGGMVSVEFFVDGSSIGSDTNGTDGWSVSWNTNNAINGSHDLTARARDSAGNTTTSAPRQVTVDNPPIVDITVAAGSDDVEEQPSTGKINSASNDLDLMNDHEVVQRAIGLRFRNVSVPQGATILNAYVQFTADEIHSGPTSLTLQGEASDNAAPFATTRFSLTAKPRTTASVVWSVPSWTVKRERGAAQRSPELGSVLQEIVDRPGWLAGNAVTLIITGSGTRVAKAFEGGAPPALHIEYDG